MDNNHSKTLKFTRCKNIKAIERAENSKQS